MKSIDVAVQNVLAFLALSATYYLLYKEPLHISLIFSAAVIICYWMGRLSVRFVRSMKERRLRELIDK